MNLIDSLLKLWNLAITCHILPYRVCQSRAGLKHMLVSTRSSADLGATWGLRTDGSGAADGAADGAATSAGSCGGFCDSSRQEPWWSIEVRDHFRVENLQRICESVTFCIHQVTRGRGEDSTGWSSSLGCACQGIYAFRPVYGTSQCCWMSRDAVCSLYESFSKTARAAYLLLVCLPFTPFGYSRQVDVECCQFEETFRSIPGILRSICFGHPWWWWWPCNHHAGLQCMFSDDHGGDFHGYLDRSSIAAGHLRGWNCGACHADPALGRHHFVCMDANSRWLCHHFVYGHSGILGDLAHLSVVGHWVDGV